MNLYDTDLRIRRSLLLLLLLLNMIIGLQVLLYKAEWISLLDLLNRPIRSFADMGNLIPPEFWIMLFALFVSWRGIVYSDYHVGPVNALSGFRLGIIMFFLYGLALPFTQGSPYLALYIFLFSSLMAMSSSRIAVLNQLRGGVNIRFSVPWIAGITTIILGIVTLSAALVWLARERLFSVFTAVFSALIYVLALIFSPLMWLFLRFAFWLFEVIRIDALFTALRNILIRLQLLIQSLIAMVSQWVQFLKLDKVNEIIVQLVGYKSVYLWGILTVIVLIILLVLRRTVWKREGGEDLDSQSAKMDQNLLSYLKAALRRSLEKLADNLDDLLRLRQARQYLAAARIRRIYARLLTLSAKLDLPRPAARTPLEFLPSLQALFPGLKGELSTITDAYLLVRYGELPESPEALQDVETAWHLVSAEGADQLRARRRAGRT
jgi:hypothetical protein